MNLTESDRPKHIHFFFFIIGAGAASGWAGVNGHGGSGWARKSMIHEPHWVAYRAYIPTPEDDHANEK